MTFRPIAVFTFYSFIIVFFMLLILGAKHVEDPYIGLGQVCTIFYFSYFFILVPVVGIIENTLMDLSIYKNTLTNNKN